MKLDELDKLCDSATPGPWVVVNEPDAEFIAAARTMVPRMIKALKSSRCHWHWWLAKHNDEITSCGECDYCKAIAELEQP